MVNYNNPNMNLQQPNIMNNNQQQIPNQFPYGNNNMLLNNTPYDNYMGRMNNSQNLLSNQYLKCRPVSSRDEARAYQIDLDGSLWVFTDLGNERIYTKQVNNNGTATFKTYALTEDESPYNNSSNEYVTKEEFNKVVSALMAAIQPSTNNQQIQEKVESVNNNKNENSTATLMNFQ